MNKNFPNLFIVGSAKSGSTSFHNYLNQHTDIYMSTPKEPKYLSYTNGVVDYNGPGDRAVKNKIIKNESEYLELFDSTFKIIGESSADNLYYHKKVIPSIKKKSRDPYIIILLRNPVERAFSAYNHLVRDQRERLTFREGLEKENLRIEKGYEFIWHYKQCGLYYNQVNDYMNNFDNVKVILFEDLKRDANGTVSSVFEFLGLGKKEVNINKTYNPSGVPDNNYKDLVFNGIKRGWATVPNSVKSFISQEFRDKYYEILKEELFNKNLKKMKLEEGLRNELKLFFEPDLKKLEKLINKNLKTWMI